MVAIQVRRITFATTQQTMFHNRPVRGSPGHAGIQGQTRRSRQESFICVSLTPPQVSRANTGKLEQHEKNQKKMTTCLSEVPKMRKNSTAPEMFYLIRCRVVVERSGRIRQGPA
jgi:hypothetical protein